VIFNDSIVTSFFFLNYINIRSPLDPKGGSVASITISDNLKDMASDTEGNKSVQKPSSFLYVAAASALFGAIGTQNLRSHSSRKTFVLSKLIHLSRQGMGAVLGWTAPAFADMERTDSEPRLTDDDKDIKTWIGSSMTLGALVGALSSGKTSQ